MPADLTGDRSHYKRQTKLTFKPSQATSSAAMSSVRATLPASRPLRKPSLFGRSTFDSGGTQDKALTSGRHHVIPQTPLKDKENHRTSVKSLATPAPSSQSEPDNHRTRGYLEVTDANSSKVSIPNPFILEDFSERLSLSPFKPLLSPERSDPVSPLIAAPSFKSAFRRRLGLGYDGADDDEDSEMSTNSLWEEKDETAPNDPRAQRRGRPSLAITVISDTEMEDVEMEDSDEDPFQPHVERGRTRYRTPRILDSSAQKAPQRSVSARRLKVGRNLYSSPVARSRSKESERESAIFTPLAENSDPTYERVITAADFEYDDDEGDVVAWTPRQSRSILARQSATPTTQRVLRPGFGYQSAVSLSKPETTGGFDAPGDEDDLPEVSCIKVSSGRKLRGHARGSSSLQLDKNKIWSGRKRRYSVRSTSLMRIGQNNGDDERDEDRMKLSSLVKKRKISGLGADLVSSSPGTWQRRVSNTQLDQEDSTPTTSRRRPGKIPKSSSQMVDVESEDEQPRQLRELRRTKVQMKRDKAFEQLKRKRAGEKVDILAPTESDDDDPTKPVYDPDPDHAYLSQFSDEEVEQRKRRPRRSGRRNVDEFEDFIDDGDDAARAPLGFTREAHKGMKEHFKDAVEWMVQNRINPGFESKNEIYIQAFRKLSDECSTLATSKFMSSTWNEKFHRALKARPGCRSVRLNTVEQMTETKCQACGRSRHTAQYKICFSGRPYHLDTLQEFDRDTDEETDQEMDSESNQSFDKDNQSLPGEDKEWHVGINCNENALWAHRLLHWKHDLNETVKDRLRKDGHLTPEKLVERDSFSRKQLHTYANNIVKEWHGEGTEEGPGGAGTPLRVFYNYYKARLQGARDHRVGSHSGK